MFVGLSKTQFDWNAGNKTKCRKHGVSIETIEALFGIDPLVFKDASHSGREPRFDAIGIVNGRRLFVVFTMRSISNEIRIRPISARFTHKSEYDEHVERAEAVPAIQDRS